MRNELKPNIDFIEKIFPEVIELTKKGCSYILNTSGFDIDLLSENRLKMKSDIAKIKMEDVYFKEIENKLKNIIGKDINNYHNINTWFTPDYEYVAFMICLSDPIKINDFSKEELEEIVTKIWKRGFLEKYQLNYQISKFSYKLIYYYKKLLEINFKSYKSEYFEKEEGHFFDGSIEEIVNEIWENK